VAVDTGPATRYAPSMLLEVQSLVKLTAVDGVSFGVAAGACTGLLGPNGAGKIEEGSGILLFSLYRPQE